MGQHLMQSASDVFLGWTRGKNGRNYYLRQLRDVKVSPVIEGWEGNLLRAYGRMCGWALARAPCTVRRRRYDLRLYGFERGLR